MPILLSTCVDRLERGLGWESGYKRPKATCCKGRLQAFGSCTRVNACARHRGRGGAFESVGSAARRSTKCSRVRICEAAALLGLTAVRPYGRFQSRASCSEEPSSALMARFARDRGRLRSRRKRRVNPRSYFDADPGQSGPLSQRRAPVGDSVPHGAAVERRSAQRPNFYAPFLATVYTRGQF